MPSQLDILRNGGAVEFEPGVSGRLNKEKKTVELSNGRILNAANDKDFFPANESDLKMSKQREYVEKSASGPAGEFLHQYTSQGLAGGASDMISYLTQSGEDYANRKAASQAVSQRISKESPYISAGATGANIATDIALTRGMSGLKAAPLLTLGSSGSRILTEPEQVVGETALSAGLGFGLDKATNYLGRIAQRRGEIRNLPAKQQAVQESNRIGKAAVQESNLLANEEHNLLKSNVRTENEARLSQYRTELTARENAMIDSKNIYEKARSDRAIEVTRLKNEAEVAKVQRQADAAAKDAKYKTAKLAAEQEEARLLAESKLAQTQYKQYLADLPKVQAQAQKEYSAEVIRNAEGIAKAFGDRARISTQSLGVQQFIDDALTKSGRAGSREAAQSSKILNSLFPEGETISGRELSKRYRALEGAIQKSSSEVQSVLTEFKHSMGQRLPSILEDNLAYNRVAPTLQRYIGREVESALKAIPLAEVGDVTRGFLSKKSRQNIQQMFSSLTPQDFLSRLRSGELKQDLMRQILSPEDFAINFSPLRKSSKHVHISKADAEKLGANLTPPGMQKYTQFERMISPKLDKFLDNARFKLIGIEEDAARKLGAKVRKTGGMAASVPEPIAPVAPSPVEMPTPPVPEPPLQAVNFPPPIQPPADLPMPSRKPNVQQPSPPATQTFQPQPEPSLAHSQSLSDTAGDFLEQSMLSGKGMFDNPLAKLAGLKYALGPAALPVEAGYGAMKALTSPTAGGEAARMTFKTGGIQYIERLAQKYPSYQNGVLQNPMDRRSLTKEIEDLPDVPIEQKALLQSKINRGKPLQAPL